MYIPPQTECYFCGRALKIDDLLQKVYITREVPDGLCKMVGSDTYMEFVFVHFNAPSSCYSFEDKVTERWKLKQNESKK